MTSPTPGSQSASAETRRVPSQRPIPYDWRQDPVGLYLHVPFCESKCIYCDFNSYARMDDLYASFVDAICADIRGGASRHMPGTPDCAGARIDTIFFGGGTPSVLTPVQIGTILDAARCRYSIASDAEVTIEANPGTISLEHFKGYLEAGVNRLSMGVQVLDDVMLKKLGRIHTAQGALDSYRLARDAGFDNINLDFIYGLPGQDLAHLSEVLDRLLVVSPQPEHLSCYSLIVEEHTPLYVGVARGLVEVPGEDVVADMYELISEKLEAAGYTQYEISNWSKQRPCRHNLIYWHNGRYLAYGPGASGYWGDTRYGTVLAPRAYIELAQRGESTLRETEHIDRRGEMSEFMILGLRLNEGVSSSQFRQRFGTSLHEVYGSECDLLRTEGLLVIGSDRIALTPRGRLLGNEVFERFLS